MRFREWIKNRYNVIILIVCLFMFALLFQLSILTIARGDEYREEADTKRLRTILTTAPRGEIRDRNGKLLAGNLPTFTVQLFKDELNRYDNVTSKEEKNLKKNEAFLTLVRLLEEDGVNYADEYPLEFNVFAYKTLEEYDKKNAVDPLEKISNIIIENELIPELLKLQYKNNMYKDHFTYNVFNRVLHIYKNKGIDLPIEAVNIENGVELKFKENIDIVSWKEKNDFHIDSTPEQIVTSYIDGDSTIIKQILEHPAARKEVYDLLVSYDLEENIELKEYSLSYEDEYLKQKRLLSQTYPEVTMETSAEEDFVNIFKNVSLKEFLEQSYEYNEEYIVPAEILLELLEEKGIEVPVEIEKDNKENSFNFIYTGKEEITKEEIIDKLVNYSIDGKVLNKFIKDERIIAKAQTSLLDNGVNPNISISEEDIEYVQINNLNRFYNENGIKDTDLDIDNEELLNKIAENYNIDLNLSRYEIRGILNIYDQIKRQGYLAYQPINIAYGIKDETVAKIEESLMGVPGIEISIEPVRYYPEGESAAHILGYLGKISQPKEIEKYVEEQGYSKNAIIGKTGIEESMESNLSGTMGEKIVEVDSTGNTIRDIEPKTIPPVPGDNVYLSIDLDLQKKAEEALDKTIKGLQGNGVFESEWGNYNFITNRGRPYKNANTGAVVVLDVKTGQVLASASNPAYDPNLFSTGISSTDWSKLFPEDERDLLAPRPLYNIATQTAVQPGSVYKMAVALTALDKGLSPDKTIYDSGYVKIGEKSFNCLIWTTSRGSHGNVDVRKAIQDSCNHYFYSLALGKNQRRNEDIGVQIDIEDIAEMSTKLGLNDKTGIEINVPREFEGGVPNSTSKLGTTKALLRNYLNNNIDDFSKENLSKNEDRKKEVIEEIVSWLDLDKPLTSAETYKRMKDLKIDVDKRTKGGTTIVDTVKYTYIDYANWTITDTLNATIGQGENQYTPIQIANYIATIANDGYRHKLSVLDSIKNYDNTETIYSHKADPERIELNDYNDLEAIREGMRLVATNGTAQGVFRNFPIEVGAKTGTAEKSGKNPVTNEKYDNFSWFVGFAPYDDPEIAVATLIFQGGSGVNGAPLVREIVAEYFNLNTELEEDFNKDKIPKQNSLAR